MGDRRWEEAYDGFDEAGLYAITFFAQDTLSNVSAGVQCRVLKTDTNNYIVSDAMFPSSFEPDDAETSAISSGGAVVGSVKNPELAAAASFV